MTITDDANPFTEAANHVIDQVLALGFDVTETDRGYSVTVKSRQIAVFMLDITGDFEWGWVETESGTGRTDYRFPFAQYIDSLSRRHGRKL